MTETEFSRPVRLNEVGALPHRIEMVADAGECAALAKRFALAAINQLSARATTVARSDGFFTQGSLDADVVQICSVTGDPLPLTVTQDFSILFVAANVQDSDEIELSVDESDIMEHDGQAIDLGEAVAQSLALALDPFPRGAGAEAWLKEAGIMSEDDVGPFAALKGLK
jgi:uncharacterized metal-binding protein YceD (DUF177 family)